jgi:drug/metabolite transporter (DMT)-like permease
MMRDYTLSMTAVVFFYIVYHLCQHNIPQTTNPAASLIITYVLCLILSAFLFFLFPANQGLLQAFRDVSWISYVLAIGVVGLEAGFLFVYRTGWKLSTAAIYSNVSVAVLLIPVGVLFFKERLSLINGVGIFFAVLGIVLMNIQMA